MTSDVLKSLQTQFAEKPFTEMDAVHDPFEQFNNWFNEAMSAEIPEPHAMVLSTATLVGVPSSRVVLLRNLDQRGFVFFTNYMSRKGRELLENPQAMLLFYWHGLGRQIRIEGVIEKVTQQESWEYFSSRPIASRIGAWASQQSAVIESREELEKKVAQYEKEFSGKEIPMPPTWGGYRLIPTYFEYWQGRESRLHDRLAYSIRDGEWSIQRLSP